jgi:flagellar motor switch protein FliG
MRCMDMKSRVDKAYKGKGPEGPARGSGKEAPAPSKPADPSPPIPPESVDDGLIKKVSADRGFRKVAKFLILLGQEEAAKVMRHLKPDELEGVVREISTIKSIEKVEADAILAEFRGLIERGALSPRGGSDTAQEILESAFGKEKGQAILKKAVPGTDKPFALVSECDATQVLILLKDESPHVMAIVLPHLDPKVASEILVRLPEGQRNETVRRMAKLDKISPEVVAGIEEGLRKRIESVGKIEESEVDGVSALASILRYVDLDFEEGILDSLEDERPELVDSIKDKLFTLDDILLVRRNDLSEQLRPLADKDIALILKGKTEEFREKLLSSVSRDRRRLIEDEYEILGSVRRSDADTATREFLSRLKRLHEDGDITLEDDEDLVD